MDSANKTATSRPNNLPRHDALAQPKGTQVDNRFPADAHRIDRCASVGRIRVGETVMAIS